MCYSGRKELAKVFVRFRVPDAQVAIVVEKCQAADVGITGRGPAQARVDCLYLGQIDLKTGRFGPTSKEGDNLEYVKSISMVDLALTDSYWQIAAEGGTGERYTAL